MKMILQHFDLYMMLSELFH